MAKERPISPTPEQVEEWKAKYKEVHVVKLDDYKAWVRKPDRRDIAYSSKASDYVKGKEIVADACFLGGNTEFLTEDDYFFALSKRLDELTAIREAEIEKL